MGLFTPIKQAIDGYIRNVSSLENPSTPLSEYFGSDYTNSGESVNSKTAWKFSAVWACVRAKSQPISYFPVKLYRKLPGGREEVTNHPVLSALKNPNPFESKVSFFERSVTALDIYGNSYILPIYENGKLKELRRIPDANIDVIEVGDTVESYKVKYKVKGLQGSGNDVVYDADEILHIPNLGDSYIGKSTIEYAREDIGLEFAISRYGNEIYREGGDPRGMISMKTDLKPTQIREIEAHIREQKKRSKTLVVGAQSDYKAFSLKPADAEFIASREFNVTQIARWFGVPPYKIADLSNGATFNNVEHMGIAFLQDTIAPIVAKYEDEINRKLFFSNEQDLYVEFNMDAYLRADSASKAEQYRTGIQNGYMTVNEVRKQNNMNPVDGGDEGYIQQNMMPLSQAKNLNLNEDGEELV